MRLHLVFSVFHPDAIGGASLYTDLARFLRDQGHEVRLTTTFPYYPALQFKPGDRGILCREEGFEGMLIRRVGMILPKRHSGWRRLIPEISFLAALTLRGRFRGWTPDVVITACPMLAQVTWQHWAYLFKAVPTLAIVQDSMAHAATELGIIKAKGLGQALHAFERWSLGTASQISTISPGMKARVDEITRGSVPSVVVPNWVHGSLAARVNRMRGSAAPRKAVELFYSGNFGVKQGLPGFLRQFREVRQDWTIAVNGGGAEAATLAEQTRGWGDWLRMGSLLEEDQYVNQLLSSTACVVTQLPGVGANFLPSKLLPALAAGTPVLAVCERDTPLGAEVIEGDFGAVVRPGDEQELAAVLARWREQPAELERLGRNASHRAKLYSRERSCGMYEALLMQLVQETDFGKL
jgi:colanic acid biosynthesis glycosyl transferase WcaI